MGFWVGVIIVLFVIGSIMALKPSGIDMRLDKLRMTARRLNLNPKLIACPDWIRGKSGELGKGMIGQYGIVIDGLKVPHVRYIVVKDSGKFSLRAHEISKNSIVNFDLDKNPICLPEVMKPFVKGIEAKANSINIYWEDITYVRPATNPKYDEQQIEEDLLKMKETLIEWVKKITSD